LINSIVSNITGMLKGLVLNARSKPNLKAVDCNAGSKVSVISLDSVNPGYLINLLSTLLEGSSNPIIITPGVSLGSTIKGLMRNATVTGYEAIGSIEEHDRVVAVLPEVYLRSRGEPSSDREGVLKALAELGLCKDRVFVVSKIFEDTLGSWGASVSSGKVGGHGMRGYLREEALTLFNQLYRGLTPSKGQVVALKMLAEMLEVGGSLVTVMPTGSGKTAIFHVASRLASSNGIGSYTLVVTPLRALMRDQVRGAAKRGLSAVYIDSSVSREERERIYSVARRGLLDLLYVAPERFWDPSFRSFIERETPSLIVLDEIHVVTSWGSTFRPSYLNLARTLASYRVKSRFKPPLLGLSATLSLDNAEEIIRMLGHGRKPVIVDVSGEELPDVDLDAETPVIIRSKLLRDNLNFEVVIAPEGFERLKLLVDVVRGYVESCRSKHSDWVGVVFTGYAESRSIEWANVDVIARALKENLNVKILAYHGELGDANRRRVEELLTKRSEGEAVVVATKAFGMGVDIPNIRWVVFYTLSDSIEEFYQEAGRAGRDGREASITILYNPVDVEFKRRLARMSRLRPSYVLRISNTIARVLEGLPRDHGYLLLPLDIFKYKVYALRALEALRGAGVVDYHVVRGSRMTISPKGMGVHMKLGDSMYVTLNGEGVEVEVYTCRGNPLYDPVLFKAGGRIVLQTGKCLEKWVRVSDKEILAIEVTGELKFSRILEPQLFLDHIRSWVVEEESLENLVELVEKALAAKDRGLGAVNEVIGGSILGYLERRQRRLPETLETPRMIKCRSKCYEKVAYIIWNLVSAIGGQQGITIFYDDPWDPGELAQVYRSLSNTALNAKIRRVEKLLALISKWGWERILDEGYIVVLSKPGVKHERIAKALEGYKYHVIIQAPNTEPASRQK